MSRTRRASLVLLVAALASLGLGAGGSAYQFLWDEWWELGYVDFSAEPNLSWAPGAWPPNGVLSFVIEDSPHWGLDVQEVRRIAEEALAFWSGIPSADIRWEVSGISQASGHPVAIAVTKYRGSPTGALLEYVWDDQRADTRPSEIIGCRVLFGQSNARHLRRERERAIYRTLVHELGHCLGLDHSAAAGLPPFNSRESWDIHRRENGDPLPNWWGRGPVMSGYHPLEPPDPSDRIGASLLRPRPEWLRSVGSLYGNVLLEDGEGAVFVRVVVSKLRDDGNLEDSFARFTDSNGAFVVGGLDPGRYVLLAGPLLHDLWAGGPIFRAVHGATRAVRTTVLATPVSVSAGRRTGPVTLTMRRGENLFTDWR